MKNKLAFLRNYIQEHKVGITFGVTATAAIALMMANQVKLNKFLKEHDLFESYYQIED